MVARSGGCRQRGNSVREAHTETRSLMSSWPPGSGWVPQLCATKTDTIPLQIPQPGSTQIRLADSRLLFETGALADGVTVLKRSVSDPVVRCRLQVPWILPADRIQYSMAEQLQSGRTTAGQPDRGQDLLHPGCIFPDSQRLSNCTAQLHRSMGIRDAGFSHSYEYLLGAEFLPVR